MISARNDFPSGWTLVYWGYLMTKSYASKGNTDFICVDEDAEYVPFTHTDSGAVKLNPVQLRFMLCITMWSLRRRP